MNDDPEFEKAANKLERQIAEHFIDQNNQVIVAALLNLLASTSAISLCGDTRKEKLRHFGMLSRALRKAFIGYLDLIEEEGIVDGPVH
jgi:hypothetical protein